MKSYKVYNTVESLPKSWDGLVAHDVFLQSSYLKALEEATPNNMQLFYVGIFKANQLVGVAIIQRVQLYLKDMFRTINVSCVKEWVQNAVSKVLKGNVLVVGNLTHTGQHGLFFQKETISQSEYLNLVFDALQAIKKHIKTTQNKTVRAIIFKDYFLNDAIHLEKQFFNTHKLHKVTVQPNMVLKLQPDWVTINNYETALSKKYKNRFKTARKKLNGITCLELGLEAIKTHSNTLQVLYLNVSNHAKFNTFILSEHHFYNLKRYLQDNFKVFGYFLNEELVGFFTLILNKQQLETYFLGYDEAHQYKNQLYLNMLYSMLEFGINTKLNTVVYARTAMEIKSSVGAKPEPMIVYLKHTNRVLNAVLKQVFKLMNPKQNWQERHPFLK